MTHKTTYTIAFKDEKFLMVYHPRRRGWEMPGGHVENGETSEQTAKREYAEESGYDIKIVKIKDIGYCDVCAAILLDKISKTPEMEAKLFSELPEELSFKRSEYKETITWARKAVYNDN